MISVTIHRPCDEDLAALEQMYIEAFPPEERRLWHDVFAPKRTDCPQLNAVYADGELVGLVTLWHFPEFTYIEHFAIARPHRGRGIGGLVLEQVVQDRPVVVEVERDDTSEAHRRIAFYLRHGFTLSDYDYIQPPYAPGLPSVPLWLMTTAPIPAAGVSQTLHREVYG